MKTLKYILFFFIITLPLTAQTSTVSGTITDSGGQVWYGGTWSITFRPVPGNPGPYVTNPGGSSFTQSYNGVLDNTGSFTQADVQRNDYIAPAGSSWTFTVCPQASSTCYTQNLSITTSTLSVSSLIIPPPVVVNPQPPQMSYAYQDSEIRGPRLGTFYTNVEDSQVHYCGTYSAGTCTWSILASASGGTFNNITITGNDNVLDGTLTGGAVNPATLNGVAPTTANFFSGNHAGSNPFNATTGNSVAGSADTGSVDRHFFTLKDTSEFDAVGGYTPEFFSGYWSSAGAGASYLDRVIDWDQSQCQYTVQAYMYYTSSNVLDFIGVTPLATNGGVISYPYYGVGFKSGNFIYNDAVNGQTTLVSSANLTNGAWYLVTFASVCDADNDTRTPVISLRQVFPVSTYAYSTIISGSTLTASFNVLAESDSLSDLQWGLRYAAGSSQIPDTAPLLTGLYYQQFNVPHSGTAKMSAYPLQWTADNTAGGDTGVNIYAYIPPNYDPSKQSPWVLYSHGSTQSGAEAFYSGNEAYVITALANAGYVVITTDESNASLECWGNQSCVEDMGNVIASWQSMLNLASRPYVIGESMGGVVVLNGIAHGTIPLPIAYVGIYPTYNLSNNYTYNSTITPQLNAAYSCSSLATCTVAWSGYDPSLDPISTYARIPMDVWCSQGDLVIQCSANGQALVNAVNAAGGSAIYNASSGNHGDSSNFNPAAIVAFFNSH